LLLNKRTYKVNESKERVPKIANYYKNYLTFFCNPIFRDFKINSIIQVYSDNKAELYYNRTYTNKPKKESKKSVHSFLFNSVVRDDINNNFLTEVSEDHKNNDNSIFNDEFFIYRPDKKRCNEETSFFLNYSKNNSHIKSGLLTMQSREEDILNIVSNLNKPLNERIIDKIQKSSTKKTVKNTYNFSTTDRSKGDDASNYANNLNLLAKKSIDIMKSEEKQIVKVSVVQKQQQPTSKEIETRKIDTFQMINSNNQNYISETEKENTTKKKVESFNISNVPKSSRHNMSNSNNRNSENTSKSPAPITVRNNGSKPGLIDPSCKAPTATLINSNVYNKVFDYKLVKNDNIHNSTKFANLLSANASEANKISSTTQRNNNNTNSGVSAVSNAGTKTLKTHHKNVKSFDFNKITTALETPTYQNYVNQDLKYFEMISTTNNKNTEEKETILSLNYNKNSKMGKSSNNYDTLLLRSKAGQESLTRTNDKATEKKDIDVYLTNAKFTKLHSDQNLIANNRAKLNNYLTNTNANANTNPNPNEKKTVSNNQYSGLPENSHRMISSISIKATGSKSQVKINFNDRVPSSNRSNNDKNVEKRLSKNYCQPEPKISITTKSSSKPKDNNNNLITDKSIKNTPSNRRMNSGDFYYNNYLKTNNINMNSLIQKTTSARNVGYVAKK